MSKTTSTPKAQEAVEVAPVEVEAQTGALSASDVARLCNAQPKDFRRWMRASLRAVGAGESLPGKGKRYAYTPEQAAQIVALYGRTKAQGSNAAASALLASLAPVAPVEVAPVEA